MKVAGMRAFLSLVTGSMLFLFSLGAWAQHPVGAEFLANTYTTNPQTNPSLAVDAAGNFLVVWTASPGANLEVFGQRFSNGGIAGGTEFRINTYTTLHQRFPSVAFTPPAGFVVVWESYDQDGSYLGIFGRRFSTSGAAAGAEFRANSVVTEDQSFASVAAASDGRFVVVWQSLDQDGDDWGIFGQRFSSSGAKLGAEFQVNTYETGDQIRPSVAVEGNGDFVVVWQRGTLPPNTGGLAGVFGQRFSNSGTKLGTEFQVSNATSGRGDPAIASDDSGTFLVVWHGAGDVSGKRFSSSGGVLGAEFRVNSFTAGSQQAPAIASDVAGDFIVVWQNGGGVSGQRLSNGGVPQGPEFPVNTYTTGSQGAPSVAAQFSGEFVVAWAGAGAGDSYGIFGRIFDDLIFADGFEVLP
ncbi:MAG: hypothetical protein ACREQQ_12225 [Candidatus Binatia bacterium]